MASKEEMHPMYEFKPQEDIDIRERTLKKFKLNGVIDTDRVIGRGSFAVVVELNFRGLKCAGKRLQQKIYQDTNLEITKQKLLESFKDECELLESTKHPHIVQFLGIAYMQSDYPFPTLVMEYLPTTLDNFIKKHKTRPQEDSYTILEDVAVALCYLHGHDPKIIHRDLSANNVLLTQDLRAKLSDLGVAKMLNLTPVQQTHQKLSTRPGTLEYMPPEALEHNPVYDTSIDSFSYGVMVLHVLSGECPIPSASTYYDHGTKKTLARTELERRRTYLDKLNDHPLLDLIEKCLNMDPKMRPCADKILATVHKEASCFTDQHTTKAQMIEKVGGLKRQLDEVTEEREKIQKEMQKKLENERDSSERNLKEQRDDYVEALQVEIHAHEQMCERNYELETKINQVETERNNLEMNLNRQEERRVTQKHTLADVRQNLRTKNKEISTLESVLEDRDKNVHLLGETVKAKAQELCGMKQEIDGKNRELQSKTEELSAKDDQLIGSKQQLEATKKQLILSREEVELRERQLKKAQRIITDMGEKQNKIYNLSFHIQQGADMPIAMSDAQCTVIGNKAYVGGGLTEDETSQASQHVFEYNVPNNSWTTLPMCPTKWFGLGHMNGKLLLIGGLRTSQSDDEKNPSSFSASVYEFEVHSRTWNTEVIPDMNVKRYLHTVVSHANALAVCGGIVHGGHATASTEVLVDGQWHTAPNLPSPCSCAKAVVANNTCYLMGGLYSFSPKQPFKCVQSIPVSSFFYAHTSERESLSSWKATSPGESYVIQYKMAPANLCGILLAVGGWDHGSHSEIDTIVAFSQEANVWVKVAQLPVMRSSCVASSMTQNGEIVIVGGIDGETKKQSASTWLMSMKL